MQRAIRHKTIINAVRGSSEARIADLARATGASAMTLRRDLDELALQGVLRRTHGGAVALPARGTRLPYSLRLETNTGLKQRIGAAAANLVTDESSVIIDDGTTCTAVARALAGREVTAMALSIHGAAALGERPGTRIVTPGGELNGDELSWTGHRAARDVLDFRADVAILGVCAWDEESGLTASTMQDADFKKAALASARRVIAVTTPEKFGMTATFAVCATGALDTVITSRAPAEARAWLAAAGVELVEAGP
ncbi:hypothetical protein BJH93_07145 [Kocuria polaris]|nr:hypothetical protein [Kocuria polaris]